MAGPETALATGTLPNFDQAQASASGVQPDVPPPPDPTDPNVVATAATQNYRTRGNRSFALEPGGPYAWKPNQSDYYQENSATPTMYQMKTGLVPVAHAGQIPFAVLANRAQALAEQKQALNKQVADFNLYQNVGQAPDPYQESHRNLAVADMDRFLGDVAKMYGGDQREAIREITTNPQLNRAWRERAKHWEIMGDKAKYWFTSAQDKLKGMESGKIGGTSEEKQTAQDLVNGLNAFGGPNGADVSELIQKGKRFDQTTSENEWIKEMVEPVATHALQTLESNGRARLGPNGYVLMDKYTKKTYDALRKEQVDSFIEHNGGTRQEAEQKLKAYFPDSQEVSTEKFAPPSGGDGSGSGGSKVTMAVGVEPAQSDQGGKPGGYTPIDLLGDAVTITPSNIIGGRAEDFSAHTFNKNGQPVKLYGIQFQHIDGDWKVVGRRLDTQEQEKFTKDTEGLSDEEKTQYLLNSKMGTIEHLSAKDNASHLKSYVGTDDLTSVAKQQGFDVTKPTAGKVADSSGSSIPEVNDQASYDKLEAGQAYMSGGKKYIKK